MIGTTALTRIAVTANVATAGLLGAAYGLSHRLFASADEMAHLDYAYQVSQGELPVFEDGVQLDPGFGFRAPDQWTAQHPPLFYAVAAPLVGPLARAGEYVGAGYAGRAVSALFACGVVAAIMWTARVLAPERRALWLAAGSLAATHPALVVLAGAAYNDNPFIMFACLLLCITFRMLLDGPTRARLALFAAFAAGALLTRATGAVIIGLCGLVLLISLLHRRQWRAVGGLAAAGAAAVAAVSWFYARNLRLTGNLLGGQPPEDLPYLNSRPVRSFGGVIVNPDIWYQWHGVWGHGVLDVAPTAWILLGIPTAAAALLAAGHLRTSRRPGDLGVVAVLVALPALVLVMQAEYVANRGGTSWRYLMPLIPVTTLAAAYAFTTWRRAMPALLTGWLLLAVLPLAIACGRSLVTPEPHDPGPVFPGATAATLVLGVGALAVAVVATILVAAADSPSPSRPVGSRR